MSRVTIGLDERLNTYLAACGDREHPVAERLRASTAELPESSLQIAPEQGQLLGFLVRLIGAGTALEIGTFCGYSALWIALALPDDGRLIACDINEEWTAIGRRAWQEAGVADRIDLRIGPAADTMETLEDDGWTARFDFIFIDADKGGYDAYYERALRLVRSGGLIVFDNMLRGGAVADPDDRSRTTGIIRTLNAKIAADIRVDKVLVPIGDGLTLVRKI